MYHSKKVITKAVLDMETMELLSVESYKYSGPWDLADGNESPNSGTPNEGAPNGDEGQGDQDQYFLTVDDRTRYKTQEEAVKGIQESGRRIAELTPWQQIAQEYGLRDPRDVAALLDELIEHRANQGRTQARGAEPQQTKPAAAGAGDGQVSPEQKSAIEWLSKHGAEAGLVTKTEMEELKELLGSLRENAQASDEERFERRIDEGRGYLKSELQEMGIKLPENKETAEGLLGLLEDALTNWVNLDDNRVAAFYQGGDILKQLVKDGLSNRAVVLNILKNQPAANYAAQKTNAQSQTRRATQAPTKAQSKTQTPNQNQPGKKNKLDTGEDFTSETHERAFDLLQQAMGRSQ
jgi:hypothetical protein